MVDDGACNVAVMMVVVPVKRVWGGRSLKERLLQYIHVQKFECMQLERIEKRGVGVTYARGLQEASALSSGNHKSCGMWRMVAQED